MDLPVPETLPELFLVEVPYLHPMSSLLSESRVETLLPGAHSEGISTDEGGLRGRDFPEVLSSSLNTLIFL